jgi:hypothetical protein
VPITAAVWRRCPSLLQRLVQGVELVLTPHKLRQPTRYCCLQALTQATHSHQLKHFHWLDEPFARHEAQGVEPHQALY